MWAVYFIFDSYDTSLKIWRGDDGFRWLCSNVKECAYTQSLYVTVDDIEKQRRALYLC